MLLNSILCCMAEGGKALVFMRVDCLFACNLREFLDGLDMFLEGFEPNAHCIESEMGGAFGLPIAHGYPPCFRVARAIREARLQADLAARASGFLYKAVELSQGRPGFGGTAGKVNPTVG